MTKRRRERDRPKAGPDSTYDPNKRVLLSYDSDDEGEIGPQGAAATTAVTDGPSDVTAQSAKGTGGGDAREKLRSEDSAHNGDPAVTMDGAFKAPSSAANEQPDRAKQSTQDEGEEELEVHERDPAHAPKQSNAVDEDDEYDPAEGLPENKGGTSKSRKSKRKENAYPSKNAVTNQKPALGSLSYQYEEDEEEDGWESAEDEAMAYLRAVRNERQSMPVVLRATAEDEEFAALYETGDSRGYIDEDCYIARPIVGPQPPAAITISPKQAYTNALKQRFLATRNVFSNPEKQPRVSNEDDNRPIPRPYGHKGYTECLHLTAKTSPSPSQIRPMNQASILSLLELIQKQYFKRGHHISRDTSAWIWSLLARLDDVGMMNNDEVSVLRELGKRAVIIQISFNDASTAAQLEDFGQEEGERTTGEDPASQHSQTSDSIGETDPPGPATATDKDNTLAALDMILAIVGEVFGQRDLLEFRRSWESEA